MKAELLGFFRRITFHDPRRIVVKSPTHTARIRTLLAMFPDARFVHLVRNPYELYLSTINLWKSLNEAQRMQGLGKQEWVEEYVLRTFETMYAAYEQDRTLLGDDQLYELRFEDLVENPLDNLRDIYQQLDLGEFSRIETPVQQHLAEVKNHRRNQYELSEEKRKLVRRRWGGYFERYGYEG